MIGTIRRHSQSLWWIIVAAVIVSFVWFYGASNSSMESLLARRRSEAGTLYGQEIKPALFHTARRVVGFNHYLQDRNPQSQRRTRTDEQLRMEIYQQTLIQHELEANAIVPGRDALGIALADEFKGSQPGAANPTDIRQGYNNFLQSLVKSDYTEADFTAFLRNQVSVNLLRELVSVPAALVSPREAAAEFRRENESLVASAVLFNPTNYAASVAVTPENIGRYYSNNLARYYSPEKIGLNYVRFEASNHLAAVEAELLKSPNLANLLQEAYVRQTNQSPTAFQDDKGVPLSREAALAKMREDEILRLAVQRAYKQAAEFYNGFGKNKVTAENFMEYATNSPSGGGFTIGRTPAIAAQVLPFQPPFNELSNAQEALSRINQANPFSIPLPGKSAVFIAVFRERVASAIQPLESIQARVEDEYRRQETQAAARNAAHAFLSQATNGVAAGTAFADVAAKQGLTVIDLPPFSAAMNQVEGLPAGLGVYELKNALGTAKIGDIQLLDLGGTPSVVFLKERRPVTEETVKAGLNSFSEEMRQRRQNGVFGEWFRQKMEDSGLAAMLTPEEPAGTGRTGKTR